MDNMMARYQGYQQPHMQPQTGERFKAIGIGHP